jgi:hypothetical protein
MQSSLFTLQIAVLFPTVPKGHCNQLNPRRLNVRRTETE